MLCVCVAACLSCVTDRCMLVCQMDVTCIAMMYTDMMMELIYGFGTCQTIPPPGLGPRVRAEYPNQLDYSGRCFILLMCKSIRQWLMVDMQCHAGCINVLGMDNM